MFEDLHRSDFILAYGRVSHRKIQQLELDPYPRGLLDRGLDKFGDIERGGQEFLLGMEYLAAVGTAVMDVVADVNKQALKNDRALEAQVDVANGRTDNVMIEIDVIHQQVESAEEDLSDVFQRLQGMEEWVEGLKQRLAGSQRDVAMLVYERTELAEEIEHLHGERDQINHNVNNLAAAWFDQEGEYQVIWGNMDQLMAFQVALHHGPGNPIEIDDDGSDDSVIEDGEIKARIAQGELVPIEDVPLRDEGLPVYQE